MLYYHVFLGLLGPDDVKGQRPTQEGTEIKVTGKGDSVTINDSVKVLCGGIMPATHGSTRSTRCWIRRSAHPHAEHKRHKHVDLDVNDDEHVARIHLPPKRLGRLPGSSG